MSASDILGDIDAQKFHSCVTLFLEAAPSEAVFNKAFSKYFGGQRDAATLAILAKQNPL